MGHVPLPVVRKGVQIVAGISGLSAIDGDGSGGRQGREHGWAQIKGCGLMVGASLGHPNAHRQALAGPNHREYGRGRNLTAERT